MARRKPPPPRGPQLKLAGDLSVAFVNTVEVRDNNSQVGVGSYSELLSWGLQAGVMSTLEAERLRRRAGERPDESKTTFERAMKLRSTLHRLCLAVAKGKELPESDLGSLNQALAAAFPAVRLVRGEAGIIWGWSGDEDAFDRMLWPVLLASAELLISLEGRPQIRQCAGSDCKLFFVDRSPTARRQWCERRCRHRHSSLRYYHRIGKKHRV